MNIQSIIRTLLFMAIAIIIASCNSGKDSPRDAAGDSTKTGGPKTGGEIVVSVAASLKESMEELGNQFEKETGVHVLFNFAGSNELARQIIAAPKVDLFLSAAQNWMDTVEKGGRMVAGTRRDLLSNTLVVIANSASDWKLDAPCAMTKITFKNLSLGDPEAVPAGKYARQWLGSVQCDGKPLWDGMKDRVAPAPDVRAALALVVADPQMLGIVYKTDQLAFADKTRVLYEVKDGPPIRYVVAQIAEGSNPDAGKRFLDYLASDGARAVFEKHGFTSISTKAPSTP